MRADKEGRGLEAPAFLRSTVRKPAAHTFVTGPDGLTTEGEMLKCCHCQRYWQVQGGSGIKRGFCFNCNAVTCGSHACEECVPFEKKLEIAEGRDPNKLVF